MRWNIKEKEDIKKIELWKKYLKIDENNNVLLPNELLTFSKYGFRDQKDTPHPSY